MYPSWDVASDLSFHKFINYITEHKKISKQCVLFISQEVYHFLKEKFTTIYTVS